jgi:hypothetical protein
MVIFLEIRKFFFVNASMVSIMSIPFRRGVHKRA